MLHWTYFGSSDSGTFVPHGSSAALEVVSEVENSIELGKLFAVALPKYFKEIAVSLFPIVAFFGIFQIVSLKLNKTVLIKICIGLFYTYIGLVLFLTGANVGFIPAGNYLGMVLGNLHYNWILVPLGMVIGYFYCKSRACGICADEAGRGTD